MKEGKLTKSEKITRSIIEHYDGKKAREMNDTLRLARKCACEDMIKYMEEKCNEEEGSELCDCGHVKGYRLILAAKEYLKTL